MARPLIFPSSSYFPVHIFSFSYPVFTVLAVLSVFSIVMYLCASHKMRTKEDVFSKRKQQASNIFSRFTKANSNISISSKALLKMISGRRQQVQHGYEDHGHGDLDDDDDMNGYYGEKDEDVVWKKTIIMGEKCRPLDFSGKIEYDLDGNLLHP